MRAVIGVAGMGALSACVGAAPAVDNGAPVRVTDAAAPLTYADGARARKLADVQCRGRVRTSIYDRFDDAAGTWVFPEGCA
jgi:hypothetical protein